LLQNKLLIIENEAIKDITFKLFKILIFDLYTTPHCFTNKSKATFKAAFADPKRGGVELFA